MKKASFAELCQSVQQAWTPKDGVIVKLKQGSNNDNELLLCVGGHRNPDFVARQCVVWEGDTKIYDGLLNHYLLRRVLTEHKVCYGEITNARLMEHNRRGILACYMDCNRCAKKCRLRNSKIIQMAEGIGMAVPQQ